MTEKSEGERMSEALPDGMVEMTGETFVALVVLAAEAGCRYGLERGGHVPRFGPMAAAHLDGLIERISDNYRGGLPQTLAEAMRSGVGRQVEVAANEYFDRPTGEVVERTMRFHERSGTTATNAKRLDLTKAARERPRPKREVLFEPKKPRVPKGD